MGVIDTNKFYKISNTKKISINKKDDNIDTQKAKVQLL